MADSPQRRKVAIVALSMLGEPEIATALSNLYDDQPTKEAGDKVQSQAIPVNQMAVPDPVRAKAAPPGGPFLTGWVYLGHYDGQSWRTRYLSFAPDDKPSDLSNRSLKVREETGALNVRSGPPGFLGRTQKIIAVLEAGSTVVLKGKPNTTISGYVWHEVQYSE